MEEDLSLSSQQISSGISPFHDGQGSEASEVVDEYEEVNIFTGDEETQNIDEEEGDDTQEGNVAIGYEFESSQLGSQLGTNHGVADNSGLSNSHSFASINKSTISASIVNLANTIVGSGMLALPYALASSGYILGLFFLVLFACLSSLGLHLLSSCALKVGIPSNFRAVTSAALPGGWWSIIIDTAVALKCFGVATSYLVVFADSLPDIMEQILSNSHISKDNMLFSRQLWVLVGSCFAGPLCFLRSFEKLKFTSMLSLFFVLFLTMLVFLTAVSPGNIIDADRDDDVVSTIQDDNNIIDDAIATPHTHDNDVQTHLFLMNGNTFSQISVFIFGFTCQQNVFPIANELKNLNQKRIDIVTSSSIFIAFCVYLTVAMAGYSYFGSDVQSDILTSYGKRDPVVVTARFCVALLVCFSYPLQCHPSCMCIASILNSTFPEFYKRERSIRIQDIITACFVTFSISVALVVSDLGIVLGVVGATGSTMVSFVIPGACYFKLFPHPHFKRKLAFLQLSLGLMIIPMALTAIALYSSPE